MLAAGGSVQIYWNARGYYFWRVPAEVEVAREAVDQRQGGQKHYKCDPGSVEPEASAGDPERPHRVALHNGRMAVIPADGEAEEQGAAGLPGEVESPAHPQGAGAQIRHGEKPAERNGNANARARRSGLKCLQNTVKSGESECRAHSAQRAGKALKAVAAECDLFSHRRQRKEGRIGREPAPRRRAAG